MCYLILPSVPLSIDECWEKQIKCMNTNINDFVSALNSRRFFAKIGSNGQVFLTIKDDDGKTVFINRAVVNVGVDEQGQPIPAVDANGNKTYTWVKGKTLETRQTVPVQGALAI